MGCSAAQAAALETALGLAQQNKNRAGEMERRCAEIELVRKAELQQTVQDRLVDAKLNQHAVARQRAKAQSASFRIRARQQRLPEDENESEAS